MNWSTRSINRIFPCSTSVIALTAVDIDFEHDAISNTVLMVIGSVFG